MRFLTTHSMNPTKPTPWNPVPYQSSTFTPSGPFFIIGSFLVAISAPFLLLSFFFSSFSIPQTIAITFPPSSSSSSLSDSSGKGEGVNVEANGEGSGIVDGADGRGTLGGVREESGSVVPVAPNPVSAPNPASNEPISNNPNPDTSALNPHSTTDTTTSTKIDLDALARAVAVAETSGCSKGVGKSRNNCFGIRRHGEFVRYASREESFADFKQLWISRYGDTLPNYKLAQK